MAVAVDAGVEEMLSVEVVAGFQGFLVTEYSVFINQLISASAASQLFYDFT